MKKRSLQSLLILSAVLIAIAVFAFMNFRNEAPKSAHKVNSGRRVAGEQTVSSKSPKPVAAQSTNLRQTRQSATSNPQDRAKEIETAKKALDSSSSAERYRAILQLRHMGSAAAVKLLASRLSDKDPEETAQIINALGTVGGQSEDGNTKELVLQVLEAKAQDENFPNRGEALAWAAKLGKDRLLPVVSQYLAKNTEYSNTAAVGALSLISSPACVPYLKKLLDRIHQPMSRLNLYSTLAAIDTPDSMAILQDRMATSSGTDQATVAGVLARMGKSETDQMLSQAIADKTLGADSVNALAISPQAPEIFSDLLKNDALPKEDTLSLLKVLSVRAPYGSQQTRAGLADALSPLLQSDDSQLQSQAIKTFGKIADPMSAQLLVPLLHSDDSTVRYEAFAAFVPHASPEDYKVLLTNFLADSDKTIRREAMLSAERFVTSADRQTLEEATKSSDPFIREHAEALLKKMN